MANILLRAFLGLCLVALIAVPFGGARAQVAIEPLLTETIHAGEFAVPINKSQVLRVDQPFTELLIGNPEIADVVALTNQSVYVLGKQLGTTNLTIYGPRRQLLAVLDLVVSYDVDSLKAKLHEVMPGEAIGTVEPNPNEKKPEKPVVKLVPKPKGDGMPSIGITRGTARQEYKVTRDGTVLQPNMQYEPSVKKQADEAPAVPPVAPPPVQVPPSMPTAAATSS